MRATILFSLTVLAAACSSETSRPAPSTVAGDDAGVPDAASVSPSREPYPAGPYGIAIGDVMPDFDVLGYALSRDARDPTRLPFRRVHVSELRDGRCECLIALWDVSGFTCPWSALAGQALSDAVDSDPTFCAIEVLDGNFDTLKQGVIGSMAPTTRADLDAFTSAARQNYPVGIVTSSTRKALSGDAMFSFPVNFVIDARTMRLVDVFPGLPTNFVERAKQSCRGATSVVETLATGLAPRQLAMTSEFVFVADERGLLRFPVAGGPPTQISGVTAPTAVVANGDTVAWIAGADVGRVEGETGVVLATAPAVHRGVALDGTHVYVTRDDGVVAAVPLAGGPSVTLLSGEATPTSIVRVEDDVVFLASGVNQVIRAPKNGGNRTPVSWTAPVGLGDAAVPTNVVSWSLGFAVVLQDADVASIVPMTTQRAPGVLTPFTVQGRFSSVALEPTRFVGSVARNGAGVVFVQPELITPEEEPRLVAGQPNVTAVAANATHVYWLTGEGGAGARDGALRRRAR